MQAVRCTPVVMSRFVQGCSKCLQANGNDDDHIYIRQHGNVSLAWLDHSQSVGVLCRITGTSSAQHRHRQPTIACTVMRRSCTAQPVSIVAVHGISQVSCADQRFDLSKPALPPSGVGCSYHVPIYTDSIHPHSGTEMSDLRGGSNANTDAAYRGMPFMLCTGAQSATRTAPLIGNRCSSSWCRWAGQRPLPLLCCQPASSAHLPGL